jgi:capsid protein
LIKLPLKIQAVEPDRIGGVYQNVVSERYVAGVIIGPLGEPVAYRVFRRSMTAGQYTDPVDVPASQFVYYSDPLRLDMYRGVTMLDTAITNLRDLYEILEYLKAKAKLAAALTVFTNSQGQTVGGGAMDGYQTSLFPNNQAGMQQDIYHGQINHLPAGTNIEFPESHTPGAEVQFAMTLMLKMVAQSYNLPYSFGIDAEALGGVSSRLESEQAKAEFNRGQKVLEPCACKIKNAFLVDAMAKGIFPVSTRKTILRGRFGYRPHPQPDLGREAQANVGLYQNGLLDPIAYWINEGRDPEAVALSMSRWVSIKKKAASAFQNTVEEVFGSGPVAPGTVDKSKDGEKENDQTALVTKS